MRFLHDYSVLAARQSWCVLCLLTLPLIAGCGGGGSNGNSGGGTTTTGTSTNTAGTNTSGNNNSGQTPQTVTGKLSSGLTASISEPSATVSVGGSVTYTMTLTNNTAAAIPVHSNGTGMAAAGVVVRNAAGATTNEPFPPPVPIYNGSLAAGQSISETVTASGFTVAGVYNATATFSDEIGANQSVGPLAVTAQ